MILHDICIFFHFIDFFVKKSLMNKSFVNEKYTFLPNFIFIDQKINDLWQAEHLMIFFHLLWHLATSSRICTSNRILSAFIWEYCTYIPNFMSIGWKMTDMIRFSIKKCALCRNSIMGEGQGQFSRYDDDFFFEMLF